MRMGAFKDLTGQRFNRWTVLERAEDYVSPKGYKAANWLCKCDCGTVRVVRGCLLTSNHSMSCGCYKEEKQRNSYIDLTGQRFGRLVAIRIYEHSKDKITWLCKCDCGNEKVVDGHELRRGGTRSCGCLHDELAAERSLKHGGTRSGQKDRLYSVWASMKDRCNNPNSDFYYRYGGRGIKVCDEWANDYAAFKKWAYENGYDDKAKFMQCTIDRIDLDKGYSPENCRWTDIVGQANLRSTSHWVTYNGKTQTIAQWAREYNMGYSALSIRLSKGWPIEKALETPVRRRKDESGSSSRT